LGGFCLLCGEFLEIMPKSKRQPKPKMKILTSIGGAISLSCLMAIFLSKAPGSAGTYFKVMQLGGYLFIIGLLRGEAWGRG
jgi:hypothetical protein